MCVWHLHTALFRPMSSKEVVGHLASPYHLNNYSLVQIIKLVRELQNLVKGTSWCNRGLEVM